MDVNLISIGGFSVFGLVTGALGYFWGYRRTIKKLIPGERDNKIINTIANISEKWNVPIDDLAKEARKDLKEKVKDKLFGNRKK